MRGAMDTLYIDSLPAQATATLDVYKRQVLIGSVRDRARVEHVFEVCRPDVVFHAAAHKHVPLMELSPGEAVKNNVFGTLRCV